MRRRRVPQEILLLLRYIFPLPPHRHTPLARPTVNRAVSPHPTVSEIIYNIPRYDIVHTHSHSPCAAAVAVAFYHLLAALRLQTHHHHTVRTPRPRDVHCSAAVRGALARAARAYIIIIIISIYIITIIIIYIGTHLCTKTLWGLNVRLRFSQRCSGGGHANGPRAVGIYYDVCAARYTYIIVNTIRFIYIL